MTQEQIKQKEKWLKDNEEEKNTRILGQYWHYLDRWLHDKGAIVDGCDWEFRMEYREPMPKNIYLYG